MTGQTPIYGIRYPDNSTPANQLGAGLAQMGNDIEGALQAAEIPPPNPIGGTVLGSIARPYTAVIFGTVNAVLTGMSLGPIATPAKVFIAGTAMYYNSSSGSTNQAYMQLYVDGAAIADAIRQVTLPNQYYVPMSLSYALTLAPGNHTFALYGRCSAAASCGYLGAGLIVSSSP
jgi:hypothetical protein